jgi:transposase-like protein
LPFYYDDRDNFFINDKAFIITSDSVSLRYLTAVLNSSLFRCSFRDNFPELLGNTYEVRKVFVDKIPIKKSEAKAVTLFETLVDSIQFVKGYLQGRNNFMGAKRISEETKLQAVMNMLEGNGSHAEICTRFGISQTYLYRLKDKALDGMKAALGNNHKRDLSRTQQLDAELAEAKRFIGDQALAIEVLKKRR